MTNLEIYKEIRNYVKENGRASLRRNARAFSKKFGGMETEVFEQVQKFLLIGQVFSEE